jgi:transcriptional regulator with XRE-family HTH domain
MGTKGQRRAAAHAATETDQAETDRLASLGVRLKNLRRLRGLSLQAVADACDVSPSFLSLLERGQTDIALGRFSRLADFYGITLSELLLEGGGTPQPPERTKLTAAPLIERGEGVEYRLVRTDQPQVIHVRMAPFSTFSDLTAHPGEDFWIVLYGKADLLYGDHRYPMSGPELTRFSGVVPHGWANPYDATVELIAVATVPYW